MSGKDFSKIKARVLEESGGATSLAAALGITRHAVYQWDRVPACRIGQVARLTGLKPEEIRPDIFEAELMA